MSAINAWLERHQYVCLMLLAAAYLCAEPVANYIAGLL
jgi:hypothetical protein